MLLVVQSLKLNQTMFLKDEQKNRKTVNIAHDIKIGCSSEIQLFSGLLIEITRGEE